MRVLFLQRQPCIRTAKYAVGLRSTGAPFVLGFAFEGQTLTEWYGEGDDLFDHWWRIGPDSRPELERVIDEFRPDVIHSHNLPDALAVAALDVVGGSVPLIHDAHDVQSLRQTPYEDGFPEPSDSLLLEKLAISGCSSLVVVSEEMRDALAERHALPERVVVFPNYAARRDLPAQLPPPARSLRMPPRVVYQGTLSTNGGHYDLRDLFEALVAEGVHLDVYPARPAPEYEALAAATPGMTYHAMLPPRRLLEVLPQYDYGWVGFNSSLNPDHLDTALPNKLFEYLGCGLPVLTLGHRALAHFVKREGVGLVLDRVDGLLDVLHAQDVTGLRRRVAGARDRLTVEANITRITELYAKVASS